MTLAEWADMDEDEPGELVDDLLVEDEDAGYLHGAVGDKRVPARLRTGAQPREHP
jgi:hypothetical protein